MSKNRVPIWLALIVLGIGGLVAVVLGIFAYMSLTAAPFHPDPAAIPASAHADPQARWEAAVEEARALVRAQVAEQNLPGSSIAVGIDGEIVWAEGFGWVDVESRKPVTPVTRFKIGTASKVLTSAAAGLLLERERLNLDTEIRTYVPEFPEKQWPMTVRQLMAHTAGVRQDNGDEGPTLEHCERTTEGFRLFADGSLRFEPGTEYYYSNYGWTLVSAAIEAAAGERFFSFMRTHVFEPLGMDDTLVDVPSDPIPDRSAFYFPRFGGDPRYGEDGARDVDYTCFAGSSAYLSTPSDLVRFAMAINGGTLLKRETVALLQTSERLPSGQETGYGLGWDIETVTLNGQETRVVGHDGEVMGGMVASLLTIPERRLVVAVTSNIAFSDTFTLAAKVAEVFAKHGKAAPAR